MGRARVTGMEADGVWDRVGAIRRARRAAGLSQRGMADRAGVSSSTVARAESRDGAVSLEVLVALLAVAGQRLAVVDGSGELVTPMRPHTMRDRAGRFFPAHLDTVPADDYTPSGSQRHYARRKPVVTFARGGLRDYSAVLRGEGWVRPADHVTVDELAQMRRDELEFRRSLLPPRTTRDLPPCECGPECELTCVQECPCQCEPAGPEWGLADETGGFRSGAPTAYPDEPGRLAGEPAPERNPGVEEHEKAEGLEDAPQLEEAEAQGLEDTGLAGGPDRSDQSFPLEEALVDATHLGDSGAQAVGPLDASSDSVSAPHGGAETECAEGGRAGSGAGVNRLYEIETPYRDEVDNPSLRVEAPDPDATGDRGVHASGEGPGETAVDLAGVNATGVAVVATGAAGVGARAGSADVGGAGERSADAGERGVGAESPGDGVPGMPPGPADG